MSSLELVRPTRGELLAIRRRILLSEKAHTVLKRKLDGLMYELVHRLEDARRAEDEINEHVLLANEELAVATMMVGELGVAIAAESIESAPELVRTEQNVFGIVIPTYRLDRVARNLEERGYSLLGTTPVVDDLVTAYEALAEATVAAAGAEAGLRLLTNEIVRTRRRVRALENRVLPELKGRRDLIQLRREELDIEEHARLFQSKKLKMRRAEESARRPPVPAEGDSPSSGRRGR
jgi:V/A-type H+-transporting ATPase subunit D